MPFQLNEIQHVQSMLKLGVHLLLGGCLLPICAQVRNPLRDAAGLLHLRRPGSWSMTPVGARRPAIPQAEMQPPRKSLLQASEAQNQRLHSRQSVSNIVWYCHSHLGLF